jgi:hypothetical protein
MMMNGKSCGCKVVEGNKNERARQKGMTPSRKEA